MRGFVCRDAQKLQVVSLSIRIPHCFLNKTLITLIGSKVIESIIGILADVLMGSRAVTIATRIVGIFVLARQHARFPQLQVLPGFPAEAPPPAPHPFPIELGKEAVPAGHATIRTKAAGAAAPLWRRPQEIPAEVVYHVPEDCGAELGQVEWPEVLPELRIQAEAGNRRRWPVSAAAASVTVVVAGATLGAATLVLVALHIDPEDPRLAEGGHKEVPEELPAEARIPFDHGGGTAENVLPEEGLEFCCAELWTPRWRRRLRR